MQTVDHKREQALFAAMAKAEQAIIAGAPAQAIEAAVAAVDAFGDQAASAAVRRTLDHEHHDESMAKAEPLRKSPYQDDSWDSGNARSWMMPRGGFTDGYFRGTTQLAPDLYAHEYGDSFVTHLLSNTSEPYHKQPREMMASYTGYPRAKYQQAPGDGFDIDASVVHPEHQRKGLTTQAYRYLAGKYGKLYSGTQTSPEADQLWKKLAQQPDLDVQLAKPGYTRHSMALKAPAAMNKTEPDHNASRAASLWVEHWDGRILWGLRRDSHKWTLPGGHLNAGEEPAAGAVRELFEETGLQPDMVYQLGQANGGPQGEIPVFIFKVIAKGDPTSENDPDNEVEEWRWVDCHMGVPPEIMQNLAHPKNVVLSYLGHQQGEQMQKSEQSSEESHSQAQHRTGFWGKQGAGALIVACDTGRVLVPHRSEHVLEPNTWGTWGGAIDHGEDPAEATRREVTEEAGYPGQVDLHHAWTFKHPSGFQYHNFIAAVDHEFEPTLNWETQAHAWVHPHELQALNPLHPGLRTLLQQPEFQTAYQAAVAGKK